jgi:hypothetical protein
MIPQYLLKRKGRTVIFRNHLKEECEYPEVEE